MMSDFRPEVEIRPFRNSHMCNEKCTI